MASEPVILTAHQWKEAIVVDNRSIQNKTNEYVYLIQDVTMPTSPISELDRKRAKILKGYQTAVIVDLGSEKIYAYTDAEDVHLAV